MSLQCKRASRLILSSIKVRFLYILLGIREVIYNKLLNLFSLVFIFCYLDVTKNAIKIFT